MDAVTKLYIGWSLYDLLCLFLFIAIGFHLKFKKKQIVALCISVAIIIAIFGNAITMDYRAYWKIMQQIVYGSHKYIHLEPIYVKLINTIGLNYELWQAIIFLPAYIGFLFIIRNLKIHNIELFLFMFVVLVMYYDCIGSRQFLFVTLYYWGIISLANKNWLLGILLLTVSAFCHKMAYMALPLIPFYFISLKNKLGKIVVLTIVATIVVRFLIAPFIEILSVITGGKGGGYLEENVTGNAGSIWWTVIRNINSFIRLGLLWYSLYITRSLVSSTNNIKRIIYSLVFITSCGSMFFRYLGFDGTISYRLLTLGDIGFCYLFTLIPEFKKITSFQKVLFSVSMIIYWIMTNAYIKGVSNSVMSGELQLE